jgi:radical SAM protein with 4Fe4S-binding SPASM domain
MNRAASEPQLKRTFRGSREALLQRATEELDLTWRVLTTLNGARILIAAGLIALFFIGSDSHVFGAQYPTIFVATATGYLLFAAGSAITLRRRWPPLGVQSVAQSLVDIAAIVALMHASGGIESGLGGLLIVFVGASSLVLPLQFPTVLAALATFAILGEQVYTQLTGFASSTNYPAAGILSAVIFAMALATRPLGQAERHPGESEGMPIDAASGTPLGPSLSPIRTYSGGAGGCPAGTHYMGIRPNGDVTPCPYLPVFAGTLRNSSLADLWTSSELFVGIRRRTSLGGRCGECEMNGHCGGCRARAYGMTGDLMAEDPLCTHTPGTFAGSPLLAIRDHASVGETQGTPTIEYGAESQTTIAWDDAAAARMKKIPAFVRGMVVKAVEESCRRNGIARVTAEELERIRARMPTPKIFGEGPSATKREGG